MDISEFTFRLLLLFFPGIICAYIIDTLTEHRPHQPFFFMMQSFAMGISSYFAYWLCYWIFSILWPQKFTFKIIMLHALIDRSIAISFREVAFVTIAAVILGLLITIFSTYKIFFRLAQKLRITNKFGELDVWGYTMNLKEVDWVTVRDHKNDLMYDGWIQAFSDDSKNAELFLRDVSVYKNQSGDFLYQVGAIYLSLNKEDIAIECRNIPISDNLERKEVEHGKGIQ